MFLNSLITYENIFNNREKNKDELLKGICFDKAIDYLSFISSQVSLQPYILDQGKLISLIFLDLDSNKSIELRDKILEIYFLNQNMVFICSLNITIGINYLLNIKNSKSKNIFTKEDKHNLIIYLLIISSDVLEYTEDIFINKSSHHFAHDKKISTWPFTIYQSKVTHYVNPIASIVKLFAFLKYFEKEPYLEYLNNFLNSYNQKSIEDYTEIFMIVSLQITNKNSHQRVYKFKANDKINFFFENLLFESKINYSKNYLDYSNILRNPIFKDKNGDYLILNWNFLLGKIYNTLVFDFYKKSNIFKNIKFKQTRDLLKIKGDEISEKIVLKNTLEYILIEKNSSLKFDIEKKSEPKPDCYYRVGNKIFIFELKDNLFSEKSLISQDIELIKEEINRKFNSKNKGTGQIVKQINHILNNKEKFIPQKIKLRNIEIFPIIVYTDNLFKLAGIESYLNRTFIKLIKEKDLSNNLKNIHDISFINLDLFITRNKLLRKSNFSKIYQHIYRKARSKKNKLLKKEDLDSLKEFTFENEFQMYTQKFNKKDLFDANILKDII